MLDKKKEMDITTYIEFIKSVIVDKDLREDIIERIYDAKNHGIVYLDGNNLYGKIFRKENNDYLEIKYNSRLIDCTYTECSSSRRVRITQDVLEGNKVYISVLEENVIKYPAGSLDGEYENIKTEYIYDGESLIYKSTSKDDSVFKSDDTRLVYMNQAFSNRLNLEREWYFGDVTIKYQVSKDYLGNVIEEHYSVCPERIESDYQNLFIFSELDREQFNSFMTGSITLDELIEANRSNYEETRKNVMRHNHVHYL